MKYPEKNHIYYTSLFIPVVIILLMLTMIGGCENKKSIKIGFAGPLTGRLSDLGVSGRDGVVLAVEEINRSGGIKGRPIELITENDRQDSKVAVRADIKLIEKGAVAIIGHMTSAMSMAALPLINREKIPLISPTTSTNKLTGIDDYFFRVMEPNKWESYSLAGYVYNEKNIRKVAAVYDRSNLAYTKGYFENFKLEFEHLGGKIIRTETFKSGPDIKFKALAQKLLKNNPDGLLIVAGSIDSAMICQSVRLSRTNIPIFSCAWAMTDDFLHYGGSSIEGVVFAQLVNRNSKEKRYLRFIEKFMERFGREPDFAAIHGYEAARLLFKALKQNDDVNKLKTTILKQTQFYGVQGDFKMDKYGDPQRKHFLITIKNRKFMTME